MSVTCFHEFRIYKSTIFFLFSYKTSLNWSIEIKKCICNYLFSQKRTLCSYFERKKSWIRNSWKHVTNRLLVSMDLNHSPILCKAFEHVLKVRLFRNAFLESSISSKKRTKILRILVNMNSFVHFLENNLLSKLNDF